MIAVTTTGDTVFELSALLVAFDEFRLAQRSVPL
jgi:hypothetical protein